MRSACGGHGAALWKLRRIVWRGGRVSCLSFRMTILYRERRTLESLGLGEFLACADRERIDPITREGHIRALAPQRGRCARGAPEAALHRMRWVRSIQAAAGLVQVRPSDVGKMTVSSSFNLLSAPSRSSILISSALRASIEPNEVTIGSLMAAL
jgi:hypothetical protein